MVKWLTMMKVFGMHLDLALILGVMGTVWTGNPLSLSPGFSIGGPGADNLLGNVLGLVGTYTLINHSIHHTDFRRRSARSARLSQLDRVRLFPDARRSLCDRQRLENEHDTLP